MFTWNVRHVGPMTCKTNDSCDYQAARSRPQKQTQPY